MIHTLFAGLFIQTHNLLPFPGLHWPFQMIPQRQHKRELCGLESVFQCAGSQEVRTVEGGVRRWEADGGRHISGGGRGQIWWQGFSCLEQPWHYDIVDSQKHTLAHPAQRHVDPVTSSTASANLRSALKACFKHCCSDAGRVKGRESGWDLWIQRCRLRIEGNCRRCSLFVFSASVLWADDAQLDRKVIRHDHVCRRNMDKYLVGLFTHLLK